jgi:hypothetical protein
MKFGWPITSKFTSQERLSKKIHCNKRTETRKKIGAWYKYITFYEKKKKEISVNICNLKNISDEFKPSNFIFAFEP